MNLDKLRERKGLPPRRQPQAPTVAELLAEDRQREAQQAPAEDAPAPARTPRPDAAARQAAHEAHQARQQQEAAQRRAAKAAEQERQRPRLPDGSTFAARYDAGRVCWTGSMTVEGRTFTAEAGGIRGLLRSLDDLYRAAIAEEIHERIHPAPAG